MPKSRCLSDDNILSRIARHYSLNCIPAPLKKGMVLLLTQAEGYSNRFVCVSVCLLPRNIGECFVSLLVEPIAGKECESFW